MLIYSVAGRKNSNKIHFCLRVHEFTIHILGKTIGFQCTCRKNPCEKSAWFLPGLSALLLCSPFWASMDFQALSLLPVHYRDSLRAVKIFNFTCTYWDDYEVNHSDSGSSEARSYCQWLLLSLWFTGCPLIALWPAWELGSTKVFGLKKK